MRNAAMRHGTAPISGRRRGDDITPSVTRCRTRPVASAARAVRTLLLGCASVLLPASGAGGAEACWARLFRESGFGQPVGEVAAIDFVGRRLRVPTAYIGRTPLGPLGEDDAVRLVAWPAGLAPLDAEQMRQLRQPGTPHVAISIFGHRHFLHGQALFDAMVSGGRHPNAHDERDGFGFRVYRAQSPIMGTQAEIHVAPSGPDEMFRCSDDPHSRFPLCKARRWIGGSLRLEMTFPKFRMADYATMSVSLERMMRCALEEDESGDRVWPPR